MTDNVKHTDGIEAGGSIDQESIDAMVLESLPVPDRLPPMLFLAALIHGILIIGVTFNAVLGDEFKDAISLEVTIVADPDPNALEPDRAEYLAQASQEGAGNTQEQVRPSARAESVVPVDNVGTESGDSIDEASEAVIFADQVLTARADQDFEVADNPREDPSPEESTAANLEAGIELTLPLPQDDRTNPSIRDDNPRELVTSVDTKESKIAGYLSTWKTKIETVGIRYFPDEALVDGITGSPTLEVTINSSGQLQEVLVRQSSGSKALDQIALSILRRAAPFDPFPEAIRMDYDQLRFAYKWQFNHLDVQAAARTE
ncbi:MAG: TonB family protein [Proteobacteria bacterium]|nr:TonB family protein [Pseudomonadota bacterium]MDA0993133.1 TonB family protein [Pseudomonadota bacterium]